LSDPAPTARAADERGLFFNGTGQAVAYSAGAALSALTFGLWVKPACAAGCRVFSLAAGAADPSVTLDISAAGQFELGAGATSELAGASPCSACAVGVTPVTSEHWYYVAGSVGGAGLADLFVNGAEEASAMGVALPTTAPRFLLGSEASPAGFRGGLDEAIVYDWLLPVADVAHLAATASP
jgi:hypothetical protein